MEQIPLFTFEEESKGKTPKQEPKSRKNNVEAIFKKGQILEYASDEGKIKKEVVFLQFYSDELSAVRLDGAFAVIPTSKLTVVNFIHK